jgi:hypothetical protein
MRSFLKSQNPASVGDCGVRMANIAIEQACHQAGLDLPALTFDHRRYHTDPQGAYALGLEELEGTNAQLAASLQEILLQTLLGQAEKQKNLDYRVTSLWQQVADVERRLNSIDTLPHDNIPVIRNFEDLLYIDDLEADVPGLRRYAADVMPNLCHFLTEHSHLYKRLIKKQIDWLQDHRDNLLKSHTGFDQYVFNPIDYLIHGQTDHGVLELTPEEWQVNRDGKAWRSQELPGGKAFWSFTCKTSTFGRAGIEEMGQCNGHLGLFDKRKRLQLLERVNAQTQSVRTQDHSVRFEGIPRLSLDNCKARLAEIKRTLGALEHWTEIAYAKLWKDACFEQVIMAELLQHGRRGPGVEEGLISMTNGLIHQLLEASNDVGEYVARTIDTLLMYIERSLDGGSREEISQ